MGVRNFLRETGLCDDWDDHDLDNNWMEVVAKAITEDYIPIKLWKENEYNEMKNRIVELKEILL